MGQLTKTVEARARVLFVRYGNYIPTVAFLWGLLWDSLTIRRPDSIFENVTVIGYLTLSAGAIILLNLIRTRRIVSFTTPENLRFMLVIFMQFAFGNLMSALTVLFIKSGTFAGSIIFFALFGALLLANELVRDRYSKMHIHIAVWYTLLLSYLIISVPILIGRIGDMVFVFSVSVSIAIVGALIAILYTIAARDLIKRIYHIGSTVGAIGIVFGLLYFNGTIPPAPLMLEHIGVYHSVERTAEGNYVAAFEPPRWFELFSDTSRTYTHTSGAAAYCASSVFAPANLETPIFHRWEYFDEGQDDWVSIARIPFSIRGGRDGGFRGYTRITASLREGKWRCNVETSRGALIGRFSFTVIGGAAAPSTEEIIF